jgi:hypothetical protein
MVCYNTFSTSIVPSLLTAYLRDQRVGQLAHQDNETSGCVVVLAVLPDLW